MFWGASHLLTSLSFKESQPLGPKSLLHINLGSFPLQDFHFSPNPWAPQSLLEILSAIREAKTDQRIGGILISLEGKNLSLSQAAEIRQELEKFKQSKKPLHVFAYAFSEAGNGTTPYYLASIADDIVMQPTGSFSINGFSLESPFFKNLLDEYDLTIQSDRREKYKGVVEPFTRTEYSPEVKENLTTLLQDLFAHVKGKIAESRKISPEAMSEMLENSPWLDYQAIQKKYISELSYKDEAKERIKKKAYPKDLSKDIKFVSVQSYLSQIQPKHIAEKIGVVMLNGDVVSPGADPQAQDPFSPEGIDKAFRRVKKDKNIKAVVFRVNSPGGSVSGAEALWHAVKRTVDSGVPVVISMGDMAASAGYYLAAPATKIYALPTTLTGSIGVAFGKPNLRGTAEYFGITLDQVDVGHNADMWSITTDFSPKIWEKMKAEVDHTYEIFKGKVTQGRNLDSDTVQEIAQGQVWSGQQAKKHNLVDNLGGFYDAVAEACRLGKIEAARPDVVILNELTNPLVAFFGAMGIELVEKVRLKFLAKIPQAKLEAKASIDGIR